MLSIMDSKRSSSALVSEKWQSGLKSLSERNKHLMNKHLLSDVYFIIGAEKQKIPAHKYVLGITSWVFYNSLFILSPNTHEIHIQDVSVDNFMVLLEYIYADQINLTKENVFDILKLAIRFEIDDLECKTIDYVEKYILNVDNVMDILEKSHELNSSKLKGKCSKIIEWTISDVIASKSFLNAPKDTLQLVLDMPNLNCREFELYQGVMNWVTNYELRNNIKPEDAKKREILGALIFKIRFPTMNAEEFSECAKENGLLTSGEISSLFLKIMNKSQELILFSEEERQLKLGFHISGIWIFNRFIKWSRNYNRTITFEKHSALISVTRPVIVVGFGFLLDRHDTDMDDTMIHFNGKVEALKSKFPNLIYRLELDDNLDIVRVLLEQPVLLETDEVYLIQLSNATNGLHVINGEVRDAIANSDIEIKFVKPKQSPYVNCIAEVFIHNE